MKTSKRGKRGHALGTVLAVVLLVGAVVLAGVMFASRLEKAASGPGGQQAGGRAVSKPEAIEAILDASQQYIRAGKFAEAAAVLGEAVRSHPDSQELRAAYAGVLVEQGRLAEAYEQYVAALSIGPRDAKLEFAAGTMASLTDRPDLSLEHYSAAQTADPANATYPLYLAQVQRKMGMAEEAKASLLRVVKMQPDNAVAWGTLADMALGENKAELALQHIARARELEPRVGTWRLVEARALKRVSKPQAALLVLEGMGESERLEVQTVRLEAECRAMMGDKEGAVRRVVEAARTRPLDADLAMEAAGWLQQAGDEEGARGFAKHAQMLGDDRATDLLARLGEAD